MPSGKKAATNIVKKEIPGLIKDPLLSLYINSTQQLADLVLNGTITLEQITDIIDSGKKSPGIFTDGSLNLKTTHTLDLLNISSLLVKHRFPYKNPKPIDSTASRVYTGIIIDARGQMEVHGEFIKDKTYPCFFPEIWDENMNLIYERNMVEPESIIGKGLIHYDWTDDESSYQDRIGLDPMRIKARKVYGELRTDPVISREDALKILTVPENLRLLQEGKIVILLDQENLIKNVTPPEKTESYYTVFRSIKEYVLNMEEPPIIHDVEDSIQILYDLKFVADSPKLLESEHTKVENLADILKKINANNAFTILVEGHTADVNKPQGQMVLSIQRTQTIISELVKNGLPQEIFSYKGYGGTQPIASNATPEGRALNRRVIITARPKATYIQRY
ncbi:MAG: OmpA family protein [Treponema sp.]|nr:OmpA family protein [Candidatus Treponema equifaecale]